MNDLVSGAGLGFYGGFYPIESHNKATRVD
jgi:hypothetical protein